MSTQSSEFSWSIMSEKKRQNARRCLFGPPDRLKLRLDLDRQDKIFNETEVQRFRETWSFDPETGPLRDGPYEFIAMDPLCEIPSFYTKTYSSCESRPALGHARYTGRPCSAKRKLDLDYETNDTNIENIESLDTFVHNSVDCRLESVSADVDVGDTMASSVFGSCMDFTCSASGTTIPVLSPIPRCQDVTTPHTRPRSQVQKSMKDYLNNKKRRVVTKCQPRT